MLTLSRREFTLALGALGVSRTLSVSRVPVLQGLALPIGDASPDFDDATLLRLPAIVTRFGVVQTTTTEYFIANSDTFVGNSGSAVFAAQSVEDNAPRVLGLLTGGGYDFVETVQDGQACVQAKWCRGPECVGDHVVYADDLIEALLERGRTREE